MVIIKTKVVKSILNRMKYIDSWFWCRYTLNPYNGCEHACIYCDARSQRYYLHEDFDDTIYAKENAAQLLNDKIRNARTMLPDVVAIGGTCDAYQPAEEEYKITQQILKVLAHHKYPVSFSTKNSLILRDVELIDSIAQETWATIGVTITTVNDNLAKFLEPAASSPQERLEIINIIAQNYPKIHTVVNLMPIIPLLEDDPVWLDRLFSDCKEAGAETILAAPGVTLRDRQGEFFMQRLKHYLEETGQQFKYRDFQKAFGPGGRGNADYYVKMNKMIGKLAKKYGLKLRAPRWIPSDFRKQAYRAAEEMLLIVQQYQQQGKDPKNLQWAALKIQNLDQSLGIAAKSGQLWEIPEMKGKIRELVEKYIKKPTGLESFM